MKRIDALKKLLGQGKLSTQEELVGELADLSFEVTQSTISRDLRKIGAVKAIDPDGRTVYRLPEDVPASPVATTALAELVVDMATNGNLIVIHTTPGSASLVARHLDATQRENVLGTIAGDDCIFVAPSSLKDIKSTMKEIGESLR
ncbi:MAG: arginine repressor [Deltaproteobacteria bacterium]|nr:arginine repressor [Deltaproteobacteria bacterium]